MVRECDERSARKIQHHCHSPADTSPATVQPGGAPFAGEDNLEIATAGEPDCYGYLQLAVSVHYKTCLKSLRPPDPTQRRQRRAARALLPQVLQDHRNKLAHHPTVHAHGAEGLVHVAHALYVAQGAVD